MVSHLLNMLYKICDLLSKVIYKYKIDLKDFMRI